MAIFRNVNMSFWTDPKVVDDYTPEDRYFMLYAMTNQYTNIIGCYEISIKQMSNDLGYTKDVVERIINRFKEIHKTIDYNFDTKELFIKNWSKYNWNASPKLDNHLYSFIEKVKSDLFHDELAKIFNKRETIKENDTLLIPYRYPIDTTITNTISISSSSSIPNKIINKELELGQNEDIVRQEIRDKSIDKDIEIKKVSTNVDKVSTNVSKGYQQKVKDNNTYINNTYYSNKELNDLFIDFLDLRKKLKAVNSERAINSLIKTLSQYDDDTKYKMIENSITNSWKGVFPLKVNKTYQPKPVREEVVPDWLNKEINSKAPLPNEQKEIEDLLKEYDDP